MEVKTLVEELKFIGKYDWNSTEKLNEHHEILQMYFKKISIPFEKLKIHDLSNQQITSVRESFGEWIKFICQNYYKYKFTEDVTYSFILEKDQPFYGFQTNQIIDNKIRSDDIKIENGLYDNLASHFNVEFMNFFRLFHDKDTNEKINPNLDYTDIKNVINEYLIMDFDREEMEKILLCLYGKFSNLFFNETCNDNEMDIVLPFNLFDTVLPSLKRIQTKCTPYQIFGSIHFFVHSWIFLHPELIVSLNDIQEVSIANSVTHELTKFIEISKMEAATYDAVERTLYCFTLFPGLRDIYIYSKAFNEEKEEIKNRVRLLAFRPRRNKESMVTFQPKLCKRIDGFNFKIHTLKYFWDESMFVDKEPITDGVKLEILSLKVQLDMFYDYWLFRFVVLFEAFLTEKSQVEEYSCKTPLFIQLEPYHFVIMHNKKIKPGKLDDLIKYWFDTNKEIGIIALKSIDECRWIYYWKKLVPGFVNFQKMEHQQNITKNILRFDPLIIIQERESEINQEKKKKKTVLEILGIKK
jgi:hypothetical protein